MGAQLRVVRRRIRSVQSTKKITRAMELIASSRIVKAQQRVEASRPYAVQLTAGHGGRRARRPARWRTRCWRTREQPAKVGVLVVTSDRGLAGVVQRQRAEDRRGADRERSAPRAGAGRVRDRQEGRRATSGSAACRCAASWQGFSEVPPYAKAEEVGRHADRRTSPTGRSTSCIAPTPTSVRRSRCAPRRKRFLPIAPEEVTGTGRGRPRRVPVRARARGDPGPPAAAVRRSRRCTRRCWSRRRRRTPRAGAR